MLTADDVQAATLQVCQVAADQMVESAVTARLYLIWASLEDRLARQLGEGDEATGLARRAAAEWLESAGDPDARRAYLDHWQYAVCGYRR